MWRGGLTPELVAWLGATLALIVGAALGAALLANARWALRLTLLKGDDISSAELRGVYGGVCSAAHVVALFFAVTYVMSGVQIGGVFAAGAVAVLSAAWAGAAGGRVLAVLRGAAPQTRLNVRVVAAQGALALMLAAPWLAWGVSRPD
ncbi:MAG: hypothetical protein AB7P07_06745 [Hyphomonadaceae bacterium]